MQKAHYKILGIAVEGNKTADPATIIANSGLKVGDEIEIPGDATVTAVKRLWSLGIFDADINIEIERKVNNGVFLLIKLNEYPRIEKFVLRGLDELDEEDIDKEVSFTTGQILKPQSIYKSKREIFKLYEEEGFLNVKIAHNLFHYAKSDTTDDEITATWVNNNDPNDEYEIVYDYDRVRRGNIVKKIEKRVLLVFDVEEGEEVSVAKISFSGNSAFEDSDLKGEFDETSEKKWWKFWSSANLNKEDYEKDKALLTTFYRKNGYRDFEILADTLKYSEDKTEVEIGLKIYEGPQYIVRNIVWEGNTVYSNQDLNRRLNFAKGDLFDYERFNQNLRFNQQQTDVSSMYQDNGYLGFNLTTREEKVSNDSLDIVIRVTENNRFRVGRIDITGNDRTKDKVIRRELLTAPGDYYSRSMVINSLQQLANLKYFNVEKLYQSGVNPTPVNDSTVNLIYNVEEKSSDYLNASVGYSGSFGFSGAIGVTLTNFSISEPFQLGGGQILNFNWQFGVGNYYRTFNLGFTEPWFMDTPTSVGFDVFDTRQRYVYDLRQSGITLRVGRRLSWPDRYFYIQGMGRFQYNDVINGQKYYVEGLSREYTLGFTISRNDIDNPIFPSQGSRISLNAELSGGPILPGNVDFYKLQFRSETYRRLFNTNRIALYSSAEMSYLDELEKETKLKPFDFFFMGGNGMVIATTPLRGYEDRSIGPKNTFGDEAGGRVMTKFSMELRAALTLEPMPIYVLAFAEAGNVARNLHDTDLFDLKRSVGFGARLLINPIGLIGFDWGYGFDKKSVDGSDPGWLFHFQFGKGF